MINIQGRLSHSGSFIKEKNFCSILLMEVYLPVCFDDRDHLALQLGTAQ